MIATIVTKHKLYAGILCGLISLAAFVFHPSLVNADSTVVYVSGLLSTSQTWTSDNVYVVQDVSLASGVTLTVEGGTTLKTTSNANGITVGTGATLDVNGTTGNPVVFTSIKDDSAGGDTNGDGPSSAGNYDYNAAIRVEGGIVMADHVSFRSSLSSIDADCQWRTNAIAVQDSQINSSVSLYRCDETITMKRNNFTLPSGSIRNAISASSVAPLGISLSGADQNTFVGTGRAITVEIGNGLGVPAGKSWAIAGATGAVIKMDVLTVAGTLELNAGAIIKSSGAGFSVMNQGTVSVNGTTADPVIYTSLKDDTVGGDTTGDGTTIPSKLDTQSAFTLSDSTTLNAHNLIIRYTTYPIYATNTSEADMTDSSIMYATTPIRLALSARANIMNVYIANADIGMRVDDTAKVIVRGKFENVTYGIKSCNWNQACSVDAAYVDWGNDGPYPTTGDLVCGSVTVSQWKVGNSTAESGTFRTKNCDNSPTPDVLYANAVNSYTQQVAQTQIDCNNGFQDACDQIARMFACVGAAISLATASSPFPLPTSSPSEQASVYRSDIVNSAKIYVNTVTEPTPVMNTFTVLSRVAEVAGIWTSLNSAYNSCY